MVISSLSSSIPTGTRWGNPDSVSDSGRDRRNVLSWRKNCALVNPNFSFKLGNLRRNSEVTNKTREYRCKLKVVRNKKSKFFSHRYLIEFYETNRMSHVPHLYDVVNLLK